MKVLCVDNEYVSLSITVGKWYKLADPKVFTEQFKNGTCIIYDDKCRWIKISEKYFKNIQQIREDKLNHLGIT
jgi:hypothetical protein